MIQKRRTHFFLGVIVGTFFTGAIASEFDPLSHQKREEEAAWRVFQKEREVEHKRARHDAYLRAKKQQASSSSQSSVSSVPATKPSFAHESDDLPDISFSDWNEPKKNSDEDRTIPSAAVTESQAALHAKCIAWQRTFIMKKGSEISGDGNRNPQLIAVLPDSLIAVLCRPPERHVVKFGMDNELLPGAPCALANIQPPFAASDVDQIQRLDHNFMVIRSKKRKNDYLVRAENGEVVYILERRQDRAIMACNAKGTAVITSKHNSSVGGLMQSWTHLLFVLSEPCKVRPDSIKEFPSNYNFDTFVFSNNGSRIAAATDHLGMQVFSNEGDALQCIFSLMCGFNYHQLKPVTFLLDNGLLYSEQYQRNSPVMRRLESDENIYSSRALLEGNSSRIVRNNGAWCVLNFKNSGSFKPTIVTADTPSLLPVESQTKMTFWNSSCLCVSSDGSTIAFSVYGDSYGIHVIKLKDDSKELTPEQIQAKQLRDHCLPVQDASQSEGESCCVQ